jgi:hypothetical protein
MALGLDDFDQLQSIGDDEEQTDNENQFLDGIDQLNQSKSPLSGRHASVVSGQAAMIAGAGADVGEVNRVMLSDDPLSQRQQAAKSYYDQMHNDVLDYVSSELAASTIDPVGLVDTATQETQRVTSRQTSPASEEQAYVEQAAPKAPGTLRDELAFQMKAQNLLAEVGESQGWMEDALDFAGMVIPFALTKDMADAADVLSKDPELAAIAGPDLEAISLNFQALDPATKELIFPRIIEHIKESTKTSLFGAESSGNINQAIGILQSFLGANAGDTLAGNRVIDVGLSALDVPIGKLAKGAVTISKVSAAETVAVGRVLKHSVREAVQKMNPINVAKQAGDEEAAVVHAKAAMMDKEVATAMNTTPTDAAMSALPTQQSQWFPQVTDDLSAAMAAQLDKDMQHAQGFVRSMTNERDLLQVGAMKDSDRKLAIEGFMKKMDRKGEDYLAQNMQMESLKIVDEGTDGFTYEYVLRRTDTPPTVKQAENVVDDLPADAPPSTPVKQQIVANVQVTKTKAGSTLIEGEPSTIQKALKDAGLPLGAVNRAQGRTFVSLSGKLYDDAVAALHKSTGVDIGSPTATASERVKSRAAKARAEAEQVPTDAAGAMNKAQTPEYQKITGTVKFTRDDVTGNYNATADALEQNLARSYVQAPTSWSRGDANFDFNEAVTDSIVSSDIGAAAQSFADDFLQWTVQPLAGIKNLKARQRLDAVLLYGDTYINEGTAIRGRTFTPQELADGFDIPGQKGKVRLTSPAEVSAYYRARMFADSMYQVENHAMRRRLELEGVQEVKVGKEPIIAKVYDDFNAARMALADKPGYIIFKAETREVMDINLGQLEQDYQNGYRLVKARQSYNTSGGGMGDEVSAHADYILVRQPDIGELPANVLHYKPGYVPKVNKVEFMVKMRYGINKPGEPGAQGTMAIRGFNSLRDAETFRDEQIAKYLAANPQSSYDAAFDKFPIGGADTVSGIDAIEKGMGASGGLYTGARSQNDILFGLSGSDMKRMGALESFQRQTAHVGVLMSRNEMRVLQEQRWLNTVRDRLPSTRITGFESTALPDNAIGKALSRMRHQIQEWNGIPEVQETRMQAAMQYLHDWIMSGKRGLGFQAEGSWESLQFLKHKNPVTAVKAAVMHTLLGALNPAQLYTQASAAIIAGSRRAGVSLTGDIAGDLRTAATFGMLDNIRNETALGKVMNTLVGGQQLDARVAEAYQAYRKTGLYESAMNNADTARLSVDGLGVTMGMMKKLDTMSLMFYRSGELFNRRYSFIKEFAAWRSANPKKVLTDDDIITITKEANKDMLELNAANRAWWQGGSGTNAVRQILGMATQFMQVTAKTAELLIPGFLTGRSEVSGFTQAQKMRIFGGQMFLFGAAGVPLGNAAMNGVFNILGQQDIGPEAALAVNQGFIGFAVNGMLGNLEQPEQQLDISQRVALGNQMNEFVRSVFTSDDPLIYAALGPAGGSVGSRFMDAMRELRIFYLGSKADSWDLTGEDITAVIHELGAVTSTGNNLYKSWVMHNLNKVLDRRRNTVDERDYNFGTEMAVAFGFRPSIETSTRMIQQAVFRNEEMVNELADVRVRLMHRAIFELRMDPDKVDSIDKAIAMMDEMIDNPELRLQVQNQVEKRLFDSPKSAYDKAVSDWFKQTAVDKLSTDARIDINLGLGVAEQAVTRPFSQIMQEK